VKIFEPTMHLRLVERPLKIEGTGMVDTIKKMRVLQQMWLDKNGSGTTEWRDVPFVPPPQEESAP
jgi:hypothetical protein